MPNPNACVYVSKMDRGCDRGYSFDLIHFCFECERPVLVWGGAHIHYYSHANWRYFTKASVPDGLTVGQMDKHSSLHRLQWLLMTVKMLQGKIQTVTDRGTLKHSDLCKLAGKPNSQPAQEVKTWHCRIANDPKTLSTHAAFHTSRSRDAWDNLNIYCEQGIQEWEGGCSGEEGNAHMNQVFTIGMVCTPPEVGW